MTAFATTSTTLPAAQERASPRFGVEVVSELSAVAGPWAALEAEGIASPFQRLSFVEAYLATVADGSAVRFALVRDRAHRVQMILPLAVERRQGLRVASLLGGKQASFHLAPAARGFAAGLDAGEMPGLLREIGRRIGVDAFAFSNLPATWDGEPNPLAAGGQPSPSFGWALTLAATGEESLARAFSKETRKKFAKKEKKLAEIGPVEHRLARDATEVDLMLGVFLAQKRDRARATGLPNPFEDPAVQAFLRAACLGGLAEGRPAVELHALVAGVRIAAVAGVAVDAARGSGMFISFDGDPAIARSSPGELLLIHVIGHQCRAGRRVFDLGVGEATYKALFCPEPQPLVDVTLPVTLRGRLLTAALDRAVRAKRFVKQTPWAWALVRRFRLAKARATG